MIGPQIIRRGDGSFAIQEVDLEPMTKIQRLALGFRVWDQVRWLFEVSGEYKPRDPQIIGSKSIGSPEEIDRVVADLVGITWSALNRVRPKLTDRPDVVEKMESGEIDTQDDVARAIGMIVRHRLTEGRPSKQDPKSGYFGKGDKFTEAIEPLRRYLLGWGKKEFLFTHVNPKEAKRRLKVIDEVIDNLSKAREDIAMRSHVATLTAPPEKKRRENS